jgi:hypothetical protein
LTANWIIANIETGQAFSGQAAATQALVGNAPNTGNLVYWPQMSTAVTMAAGHNIQGLTADPLLAGNGAAPAIAAAMQDLPDMSTPYISGLTVNAGFVVTNFAAAYNNSNAQWAAKIQASQLTAALAVTSANNDFFADTAFGGATDWVFTMPTRRYNVAVKYGATPTIAYTDYTKADTVAPLTMVAALPAGAAPNLNYFDSTNVTLTGNIICVTGVTATAYNREEGTALLSSSTSFSPSAVATAVQFCGESGVWALGQTLASNTPALSSSVLQSAIAGGVTREVPINSYTEGWVQVSTPGLGVVPRGLPVVGASFSKATGAKNYGWSQPHTAGRVTGYAY